MNEPTRGQRAAAGRETEHRARRTTGWSWDEDAGDFRPFVGLRIEWRFIGERRWRRVTVVPQEGQTITDLRKGAPEIVARLVEREAEHA